MAIIIHSFQDGCLFRSGCVYFFLLYLFTLSKIVEIKELELALKLRSHQMLFDRLIFDNDGDRQNCQRILDYTGFPFETKSAEWEEKFIKLVMTFQLTSGLQFVTSCVLDVLGC